MGIRGVFGTIAGLVIGVFEGMTGVRIDLDVDGNALFPQLGGEGVDTFLGNAVVLSAEVAHHGGLYFAEVRRVCGEGSVVD